MEVPEIQFASSNGARIAYQLFGEGDEVVVSVPPMAQNIEVAWERPEPRRMFERFGSFARFLIFDKRGTGSSDRQSRMPGMDERVDDLKAVIDHAGIESAHVMGTSEGGPMAVMFAISYPHRVKSLILHATGPRVVPQEALDGIERDADGDRVYPLASKWGTADSPIVATFAPSLAKDKDFCRWHQRYERLSATQDSLRDLFDLMVDIDVTEALGHVTVPTLVQHRVGDQVIPVDYGRELATAIAGAQLLEYDGRDHFTYAGDMESLVADMERWVNGSVAPRAALTGSDLMHRGKPSVVTLGRFGVEFDGDEVTNAVWGSRLPRQILKRLVAAQGWPVTREQLIDQLWPDETDMRKLGARLSVHLSAIRRVLGGGIISDRETVRLDLDYVDCDLHKFLQATVDSAIVAAHVGEFLPEDRYEDWSSSVRDQVQRRFSAAARNLATAELKSGNTDAVCDLTNRLIDADPYDDWARRTQVTALLRSDRIGDASRAHASWTQAMAELGVEAPPFDRLVAAETAGP